MKRGRQMETNDSVIPRVVRGAANRLETDYISLALSFFVFPFVSLPLSCSFSLCFKLIWCNGNTSQSSLPCRAIGCTLSLLYTDACTACLLHVSYRYTHTQIKHSISARTGTTSDTLFRSWDTEGQNIHWQSHAVLPQTITERNQKPPKSHLIKIHWKYTK